MSAHNYWNSSDQNNQNDPYSQQQNQQHQYNQSHESYPPAYGQEQPYQAHQPPNYTQDNEPMNWGYGGGNQHQQPPQQSHDYYEPQGQSQHSSQQYSYEHNQGYGQTYQSHTQTQDSYQTHSTYNDDRHTSQPSLHAGPTGYDRQPSPGAYQVSQYPEHGYAPQTATHQPYPGDIPGQPVEGERGLLGAIGGAAAGGFAGHKVNHGFIGAVGGAYAGHKLEESLKDKKKEKKHKHQSISGGGRRGSSSSSSSSSSSDDDKKKKRHSKHHHHHGGPATMAVAGGGAAYAAHQHQQHGHDRGQQAMAGNFSTSSSQISLDRDYDLIASCSTVSGHSKLSSIKLNDCLTNSWGQLQWAQGGGFAHSARHVRLVDGGRVLEAELGDGKGGWNVSHIRLDERITNNDGDLQFLH